MKYFIKLRHMYRAVAVISADGACKITWKSVENWLRYQRKLGKKNDKNAQRSMNTVGVWLLRLSWHFFLFSFDDFWRQNQTSKNRQTVKIGCFTSPSIRAISEKQSFLVHFSAGYHILKKKKKKKSIGLCRYSVGKYSLTSGDLPCQFELLSHTWTTGGTYSALFQWRPAFSALWRRGKQCCFSASHNNFWNTLSNFTKFTGQSP